MIKPNIKKLIFSQSWTNMEGGFVTSDICHNYGIMSGCDEGCPALLSGDCPNVGDAIKCCNITDAERKQIMALYE